MNELWYIYCEHSGQSKLCCKGTTMYYENLYNDSETVSSPHPDGWTQKRHNFSPSAMELHVFALGPPHILRADSWINNLHPKDAGYPAWSLSVKLHAGLLGWVPFHCWTFNLNIGQWSIKHKPVKNLALWWLSCCQLWSHKKGATIIQVASLLPLQMLLALYYFSGYSWCNTLGYESFLK